MTERRPVAAPASLAVRALWAVALWSAFYALGLGIAALLALVPWAQNRFGGAVDAAGLASGAGAAWVLFAMFPRLDRSEIPGLEIDAARFPGVFALVRDVAVRGGGNVPEHVHLAAHANAFATSRSRRLRLRSSPVVGIGLPLLAFLERDEAASVLAHELGHHHGGDVALGPWVHRTRRAIGAAVERLDGSSFWLHLPFVAYARLFLRATAETSRAQELAADALAARLCGARVVASALVRTHELGILWDTYLELEVLPVLARGLLPDVIEGFRRFLAVEPRSRRVVEALASAAPRPSPFDTHPTLEQRLAALGCAGYSVSLPREPTAELLGDRAEANRTAARSLLRDQGAPLAPVEWTDVGEKVWMAFAREAVAARADHLAAADVRQLARIVAELDAWSGRLRIGIAILSPEAQRRRTLEVLACWLALELSARGFVAHKEPGGTLRLVRDAESVEPDEIVEALARGDLDAAAYERRAGAWEAVPSAKAVASG